MKKYRVFGNISVTVETFVEMPEGKEYDEEEIFAKAYEEFQGIDNYAGNGGIDKLVGVNNEDDALQADGEVEFTYCEPVKNE